MKWMMLAVEHCAIDLQCRDRVPNAGACLRIVTAPYRRPWRRPYGRLPGIRRICSHAASRPTGRLLGKRRLARQDEAGRLGTGSDRAGNSPMHTQPGGPRKTGRPGTGMYATSAFRARQRRAQWREAILPRPDHTPTLTTGLVQGTPLNPCPNSLKVPLKRGKGLEIVTGLKEMFHLNVFYIGNGTLGTGGKEAERRCHEGPLRSSR